MKKASMLLGHSRDKMHISTDILKVEKSDIEALQTSFRMFYGWQQTRKPILETVHARFVHQMVMKSLPK